MNRTAKLVVIAGLSLAIGYLTMDRWYETVKTLWGTGPVPNNFGFDPKTFEVKRVHVLRGDQFDIVLDDDSRVLAKLKVSASDAAKPKVIDLLNRCENPKVRLLNKQPDGSWLVDFFVTENGKEVDLAAWLSDKKLVFK